MTPAAGRATRATASNPTMPSSVIRAFAYDEARQVLTITFVSGCAYAYQGVPVDVAQGLRLAFAKGE